MPTIRNARILIMATHGFEQSELMRPLERLREAGAMVHVGAPGGPAIRGWDKNNWGATVPVDVEIGSLKAADYHCLILPGGQMNPDALRLDDRAIDLILDFLHAGKIVAAICHAPSLLIEAGAVEGRQLTSWKSVKTDVENAGGQWLDREVVVDNELITSRSPADLDAFIAKIVEGIETGEHLEGEPFKESA
jgi:protease I